MIQKRIGILVLVAIFSFAFAAKPAQAGPEDDPGWFWKFGGATSVVVGAVALSSTGYVMGNCFGGLGGCGFYVVPMLLEAGIVGFGGWMIHHGKELSAEHKGKKVTLLPNGVELASNRYRLQAGLLTATPLVDQQGSRGVYGHLLQASW